MKNNKRETQYLALTQVEEYAIIRKDLRRVLFLNLLYLVIILAIFFTNEKTQYLQHFFGKLFHF